VTIDEPLRRRGSRRAQNYLETVTAQRPDGTVHPLPVKSAWLWLEPAPGELADSDKGDSEVRHPFGVVVPDRLGPVFRIVANAKHVRTLEDMSCCVHFDDERRLGKKKGER
jgi:hypothetical protein